MSGRYRTKQKKESRLDLYPIHKPSGKTPALIGVLTTPRGKGMHPLPIGRDSRLKTEMSEVAESKGIVIFFFYPRDVNLRNQTIIGHISTDGDKTKRHWVRQVFPLPHVIYNRISFRKNEADQTIGNILASLANTPGIHLFNTRFLNKWEIYNILGQNSLTKDLVPESYLFNRKYLGFMLGKYYELFIKPINSSLGKGIIKVVTQKIGNRTVFWTRKSQDKKWQKYYSINKLYLFLQKAIDKDLYLIQRGLDLACIKGKLFDLRTEIQKISLGQWVITGTGIRIAAPGKFVTHIPNGGTKGNYEEVINNVFGCSVSTKEHINQQLAYICQTVPYVLEQELEINLGILSIDIGIEKSGHMAVIEVNSKPSSFDEDEIRQKHLENLMDYFLYLNSLNQS